MKRRRLYTSAFVAVVIAVAAGASCTQSSQLQVDEPYDDRTGATGTRAKGEEGKMGVHSPARAEREPAAAPLAEAEADEAPAQLQAPAARMKSSSKRYAVKGPKSFGMVGGLGLSGVGQGGGGTARGLGLAQKDALSELRLPSDVPNTEAYDHVDENPFMKVTESPLSTFSIDVDTASYSNVRRFLRDGQLPPKDAVRIEELVNYFSYDYVPPKADEPFSVHTEVSAAPWNAKHRLVHVGLKGKPIANENVPARNLVFLLDVSGSMNSADKLGLLKRGVGLLARQLRPKDTVSIVVYAGASGVVLQPTSGDQQHRILQSLERLTAGGSTNGGEGIQRAYALARQTFKKNGINRVILATDGDFNVGTTSEGDLTRMIERERKSGVFLTVLGFGRGNLKDSTMEMLADKGNGNYAYIDSIAEARKVLVREAGSTLVTIAKDVKLQLEFNPGRVASYRLIGYENRMLAARDFNDDKKDAGEIGAGHTVTALYEIVPAGAATPAKPAVDPLKYQSGRALSGSAASDELLTVKIRYKAPTGKTSKKISHVVRDAGAALDSTSNDFRFSAAVAGFGMILRGSEHKGSASIPVVRKLAAAALGGDPRGDRRELLAMMDRARELRGADKQIAR